MQNSFKKTLLIVFVGLALSTWPAAAMKKPAEYTGGILPIETLEIIFEYSDCRDVVKNLRLTCRDFNEAYENFNPKKIVLPKDTLFKYRNKKKPSTLFSSYAYNMPIGMKLLAALGSSNAPGAPAFAHEEIASEYKKRRDALVSFCHFLNAKIKDQKQAMIMCHNHKAAIPVEDYLEDCNRDVMPFFEKKIMTHNNREKTWTKINGLRIPFAICCCWLPSSCVFMLFLLIIILRSTAE